MNRVALYHGWGKDVLPTLPANSIDSCVCDPPYGLSKEPNMVEVLTHWLKGDDYEHSGNGFMGKSWDSFVPGPNTWREVLRVMKPGAFALVFAGSRTVDLMAVSMRLAGFEIRDQIQWIYSQGFPKSLNFGCRCGDNDKTKTERNLHNMWDTDVPTTLDSGEGQREVLQSCMPQQGAPVEGWPEFSTPEIRFGQPGMEGRSNVLSEAWELQVGQVRKMPAGVHIDVEERRLRNGASVDNGTANGEVFGSCGSGTPQGPQPTQQCAGKSGIVLKQCGTQEGRMAQNKKCSKCGGLIAWQGWGTALKPAHEPIIVARKPLTGTVAANVIEWGVGGLNIDGCRIGDEVRYASFTSLAPCHGNMLGKAGTAEARRGTQGEQQQYVGRFPANIIHDGSDEVLACFPDAPGQLAAASTSPDSLKNKNCYGSMQRIGEPSAERRYTGNGSTNFAATPGQRRGDTGSAARFFYCAKASGKDRGEGNTHPTVKPQALMRYLCRLVTPPGGTVLDSFAGSGTTGIAALDEGFRPVLIEQDEDHFAHIYGRIFNHVMNR